MRKKLLVSLAMFLLLLGISHGQEKSVGRLTANADGRGAESGRCVDRSMISSGATPARAQTTTHRFRQVGETIEIAIRGDSVSASLADCEPVALELHWSNGRNNGSNFNVTLLAEDKRPIYAKQISAFLTGVHQFSLSSFDAQPVYGSSMAMMSVPAVVTIQAVHPFAAPVSLSYTIVRAPRTLGTMGQGDRGKGANEKATQRFEDEKDQRGEIVSVREVVRLIGSSRVAVIQIELKTSRPFPLKEVALQMRIGKSVFVDELSGDHTGRRLTLSLTPEMFAELKDGDEILAYFEGVEGEGIRFGRLSKGGRQ